MIRKVIFAGALVLTACMQTENSNTQDKSTYGGGADVGSRARQIMGVSCVPCHDYHTQTDAQLIAAGRVLAGDPDNSDIYYRIIGSDSPRTPKDMPRGGSVNSEDRTVIKNWIQGITP